MKATTLRPGFLVGCNTSIRGNVKYTTETIQAETQVGDALESKWRTDKRVEDAAEHKAAVEVRSKVRTIISAVCVPSAFGLLCPKDKEQELEQAIAEARRLAEDFNFRANLTEVRIYALIARIAETDAEAISAISGEVRELVEKMEIGVNNMSVKQIRDAANEARRMAAMLSDEAREKVDDAIKSVRGLARKIVAAGEAATVEVERQVFADLAAARTAFLDLDEDVDAVVQPALGDGRAVDMIPEDELAVE